MLPEAFDRGFVTFWAHLGWSSIPVDANIYAILSVFCWLSFAGLLIGIVRGYSRAELAYLLLLAVGLLTTIAFMAYFALYSSSAQVFHGRYLMVAVTAISILLVAGFANLVPRRWQSRALTGLSLCFILWAALIPFQTIEAAYAHPAPLPASALAQLPNRMQVAFGDLFVLVGYQTDWRALSLELVSRSRSRSLVIIAASYHAAALSESPGVVGSLNMAMRPSFPARVRRGEGEITSVQLRRVKNVRMRWNGHIARKAVRRCACCSSP